MNISLPRKLPRPLAIAWLISLLTAIHASAFIPEPETVIYGRILNRTGGQSEQLVTTGELLWKIRKSDGSQISLKGRVGELQGGASYFLRIPHQALVLGQQALANSVPLGITRSDASHVEITLGGRSTRILAPATSRLDLEQALRASTYRLDLEVLLPELDTDGDGIPDWWEDLHGLDKENASDATLDGDHDGLNNLGEFLAGTLPDHDSRHPELLTKEVIAYSASRSIVALETADTDSTPAQLTYTVTALPSGGRLFLRNPDTTLTVGSTFTQAQANESRLVFEHTGAGEPGVIGVSVSDENPQHPAWPGSVRLLLFNPNPAMVAQNGAEKLRLYAHHLASSPSGHLVADLSPTAGKHLIAAASSKISAAAYPAHVAAFGAEKPHVLIGGPAADDLAGGHSDDILSGGPGADKLTGGPGADNFVFTDALDGNDTIVDFKPSENDAIDLSSVLHGTSTNLHDYVRIQTEGADAILGVSIAGAGIGYSDLKIRLKNSTLAQSDLPGLYYAGHLITGQAVLPPRLSIAAAPTKASENGPVSSSFTITREGPVDQPINVQISISGSATNGSDYQIISSTISIPAQAISATIPIIPFVDAIYEADETVTISLVPGSSYLLGNSFAQLVIEDLKPQLWTEVIESIASVDGLTPASVILHRGGAIDRPVSVQLSYSGTAVKNVDYVNPPASLAFAAWDTEKQLDIVPLPGATFGSAEGKTINLTIKQSTNYIAPTTSDRLVIVPERLTFEKWMASSPAPAAMAFSTVDSGNSGLDVLLRYGFSLDPENPFSSASRSRMPRIEFLDGHLVMRFRRKPGISDLNYQVQYTTNLKDWKTGTDYVEDISTLLAPDDPSAVIYRSKSRIADVPAASMRVVITKPENQ